MAIIQKLIYPTELKIVKFESIDLIDLRLNHSEHG